MDAKYIAFDTIEELDQAADVIVIGSPIKDFEDREHMAQYFEDGMIQDFYTMTELRIEKVIKQPDGIDIGEMMELIEPLSIIEESGNQKTKIIMDDYRELKKGSRYILFLKDNTFGQYSIINMNNGKFNLDNTDDSDMPMGQQDLAFKTSLKNQVLRKYDLY
ncbi:hypothetical protein [Paenibacillus sp. FSL M8-0142]|uniref:hypothetical protein n=1 Tax=Paenibacillus sp. FSL M8-0142 TaxID=2954525 RepID=UPI00315B1366